MNNATATRLQRTCLSTIAATIVTGILVGSPATATTDVPAGGSSTVQRSGTFDIGEYIAHRKALWAQDRVDHPWLYR